jgi:hypothetical protein
MSITVKEVNAAQKAWCKAVIKIGKLSKKSWEQARDYALVVLKEAYNYEFGPVFFRPTLTTNPATFRNDIRGALSYFVGRDPLYPYDKGFAVKNPWTKVTYKNVGVGKEDGIQFYNDIAITMGKVTFLADDGEEITVDKTFIFQKGSDNKLRLVVHKSALENKVSKK